MEFSTLKNVAIIGGGLGGLGLALALRLRSIPCTVYESRSSSFESEGAITLAPNALRFLDSWGIYKNVQIKGFNFAAMTVKDYSNRTIVARQLGSEILYGYKGLRVRRAILIQELLQAFQKLGGQVKYDKKFFRVVSESELNVTFEFADGSTEEASLLIGADGIHSRVRSYIDPSTTPVYDGILAVGCTIQKSDLRVPVDVDYTLPVTVHGIHGAFLLVPELFDGSEVLAGTQFLYPLQSREGWEKLATDKNEMLRLLRQNKTLLPDIVQSALENVAEDTLFIWPHQTIPRLESWVSRHHRVILIGDAAHAIPPSFGQGANQAIEDAHTLALILSKISDRLPTAEALRFWQSFRQKRVDKVAALTLQAGEARLSTAERATLSESKRGEKKLDGGSNDLTWLYRPYLEEEIAEWVARRVQSWGLEGPQKTDASWISRSVKRDSLL